jgi:transcriptional regulator
MAGMGSGVVLRRICMRLAPPMTRTRSIQNSSIARIVSGLLVIHPRVAVWLRNPLASLVELQRGEHSCLPSPFPSCTSTRAGVSSCRSNRGREPDAFSIDLPQGTLDLLILRTLLLEPLHGWAVSERIQQISSDVLRVQQGSLYPALHRLERRGWIKARWGTSENNRRAKFYELTKAGRRELEIERDAWEKLAAAVSQILETA